jgi:hypothetical protein
MRKEDLLKQLEECQKWIAKLKLQEKEILKNLEMFEPKKVKIKKIIEPEQTN